MPTLPFTVDSALLRELGERLVGRPHIALAELVKNSYDADATVVVIRLREDHIEIIDNGHGMTKGEFRNFWMRIGTTHKDAEQLSRHLQRPLTGSKGVGRLAVQFLARELEIRTVSETTTGKQFLGTVDWDNASRAGDLTSAEVDYQESAPTAKFPGGSKHGTSIVLRHLNQAWDEDSIKDLAREIRWLKPPLRTNPRLQSDRQKAFDIRFETEDSTLAKTFLEQMDALLDLWHAKIVGKLERDSKNRKNTRSVRITVQFSDGSEPERYEHIAEDCNLHFCEFEILIFKLQGRQAQGIKVGDAHEYLQKFGGVHIYDAGFHLPYYGLGIDWLGIEMDHSHRKTVSDLIPRELQIKRGLNFLPTQSRILGEVHVDTSYERQSRSTGEEDYLKVQITRDRLVDNRALKHLASFVRASIDFYAVNEAARSFAETEAKKDIEPVRDKVERVEQVIEEFKDEIPHEVYVRLKADVQEAVYAVDVEAEASIKQLSLLGPLATAGISALAYNHELSKQFQSLHLIAREIKAMAGGRGTTSEKLAAVSSQLDEWIEYTKSTRELFLHLGESENRDIRVRLKARPTLETIKSQAKVLTRGVEIDLDNVVIQLRLPKGSYAEWSAIFQNVFINATNAMLDSDEHYIGVSSSIHGRKASIIVQDTGVGVDLETAEDLFQPFVRKLEISPERRSLGFGGMGMGLAIVRMMATNLGCKVSFVEPEKGFSTAFQITWTEHQ